MSKLSNHKSQPPYNNTQRRRNKKIVLGNTSQAALKLGSAAMSNLLSQNAMSSGSNHNNTVHNQTAMVLKNQRQNIKVKANMTLNS